MKMKMAAALLCVAVLGVTGVESLEAQMRRGGEAGAAAGPRSGGQRGGMRPMRGPRMQGGRMGAPGMQERGMMGPMGLDLRIGQILDRRHTLDLTDRQVEQLGQLRDDVRGEAEPLRSEMEAIREGRQDGSLDRDAARERMNALGAERRALHESFSSRLHELLEPRQLAMIRAIGRRAPRR